MPNDQDFIDIEDGIEDREWLTELLVITEKELPAPKPKKKRKRR